MLIGLIILFVISLAAAKPYNPKLDSISVSENHSKYEFKNRRDPYVRWQHEPPNNSILSTGSRHVIECEAAGSPPPKIYWLKDGQHIDLGDKPIQGNSEIVDASENPVLGLSLTKSKLNLGCLKPEDSGIYTCVAENNHEKIVSESRIKVVPASSPLLSSLLSSSECSENDDLNESKKPQITMWTHTRIEKLDSSVILFCRTKGKSESRIKWINSDNKELNSVSGDGKYDLLPTGDLLIRNISWDDMGSYFCIAENAYGQDKIETFLYPTQSDKQ